jgi:hypothetical protein
LRYESTRIEAVPNWLNAAIWATLRVAVCSRGPWFWLSNRPGRKVIWPGKLSAVEAETKRLTK